MNLLADDFFIPQEIEDDGELLHGSLPIAHLGCGMFVHLVISGEARAELWLDDRISDNGVYPLDKEGFHHWYESWLDGSIAEFELYEQTRDFFLVKSCQLMGMDEQDMPS